MALDVVINPRSSHDYSGNNQASKLPDLMRRRDNDKRRKFEHPVTEPFIEGSAPNEALSSQDGLMAVATACMLAKGEAEIVPLHTLALNMLRTKSQTVSFFDHLQFTLRTPGSHAYAHDKLIHASLCDRLPKKMGLLHTLSERKVLEIPWIDLVNDFKFRPIMASFFMMRTRPCSYVFITRAILRWSTQETVSRYLNQQRQGGVPATAPRDTGTYRFLERWIRSLQVAVFPFASSLEAERLIHLQALYAKKGSS